MKQKSKMLMNLTIGFHENSNKKPKHERKKKVAEKQKALPWLLTVLLNEITFLRLSNNVSRLITHSLKSYSSLWTILPSHKLPK